MNEDTVVGERVLKTPNEISEIFGLSEKFLQNRRMDGTGPVFISASRNRPRYRIADVEQWINDRRRRSTSDGDEAA